jgi:hypothetical protein
MSPNQANLPACATGVGGREPTAAATAQEWLKVESRAKDRMVKIFDEANSTQLKTDCTPTLYGATQASCSDLTLAETQVTQNFYRAIKAATIANAANHEKYLTSCSGTVDTNMLMQFKRIREDLFMVFVLRANGVIENFPDAHKLVEGKLIDATVEVNGNKLEGQKREGIRPSERSRQIMELIKGANKPLLTPKNIEKVLDNLLADNPKELKDILK